MDAGYSGTLWTFNECGGRHQLLVENDGAERLYFVVETKSGLFADDLRDTEGAKITCGSAHFSAGGAGVAREVHRGALGA